jgi:hypothetical protein
MLLAVAAGAAAQERVTLGADVLFYGDNTEFHGPFREGDTLFGAAGRLAGRIELNPRVTVTLGLFGNHRFGGDGFDRLTPIASLALTRGRSTLVFGTLPGPALPAAGPDEAGPHGLLPPIQRDNLFLERPYEAGLQWTRRAPRARHEAWLHWQRLNTARHRERFDAGVSGRATIGGPVALGFQAHVVHEGGQRFASGPVADSAAYALGAIVERRMGAFDRAAIEAWAALARHVPDRETPERSTTGKGMFLRATAERAGWRGHLIVWRGCQYVKDEGDPNYQSVRLDGSRVAPTRDYTEAGLTRRFRPAPEVALELSARGHRIEGRYNYSFRLLGRTTLAWRLK